MSKIIITAIAGTFLGAWALTAVTVLTHDYIEWMGAHSKERHRRERNK